MLTLAAAAPLSPVQAIVLGAVQGLTELLPVSSSAHLYVVPTLLGWRYEGLAFDVALHGGTLLALILAFAGDWLRLVRDAFAFDPRARSAARRTWAQLAVATVPAAICGWLLGDLAETALRSLPLQAAMLALFGLVLWLADRLNPPGRDGMPGWGTALGMGFAQCLALVPGVSRSGITMTAGRLSGLSRTAAARFSFLLATPITFGALLLKARHVRHDVPVGTLALAVASSALFGVIAIRWLLAMIRRTGFGVFFAYRALLALVIVLYLARHPAG
jgi:undecaprenyl-diphosphatase